MTTLRCAFASALSTYDKVNVVFHMLKEYVVLVLALLKIAVPFALISCYSTPFELRHVLTLTNVTRVFAASQYLPVIIPVSQDTGVYKGIYVMNAHVDGYQSLEGLIKQARTKILPEVKTRIVPKDTLAFLVYSSGTSGLPKGSPPKTDHLLPFILTLHNTRRRNVLSWECAFRT